MTSRLIKRRLRQAKDSIKYFSVWPFFRLFGKKNNVWLVAERGNDARDNGYRMYKYLCGEHPEIEVKYVICKNSPDRRKIREEDIVEYGSLKHLYYYITSPLLISTHYQGYSPNLELFSQLDRRKLVSVCGKKVFLQHGITMGKVSWNKKNRRIDLLISGAPEEAAALLEETDYGSEIIKCTGLPRYDNLFNSKSLNGTGDILLMPTWRMIYTNYTDEQFKASDYYKAFQGLINDDEILMYLQKKNIFLNFYPHVEMHKFIHLFSTKSERVRILDTKSADVQELLLSSALLITDNSSVFFDFAYLKKPIIFYRFDREKYGEIHGKAEFRPYFEEKSFGPVVTEAKQLKCELFSLESFEMPQKYRDNVDAFFPSRDNKNCERVFSEIQKLLS